ncbi:MAG TPA: RluA family pseudouridine synthase [Vitreimonas sp.]|nr:RluA family pseudouridine synthase [Vitreimonas sp.]
MTHVLKPTILFEDNDLLLINKPPGLVLNRAQTVTEPTVQDWMEEYLGGAAGIEQIIANSQAWLAVIPAQFDAQFGTPETIFRERLGIVHRLDKDTSGVLLLAKNPGSLVHLLRQFKDRQVSKTYLCLTHGKFKLEKGVVSAPLGRASHNRLQFAVQPEGRAAITEYEVQVFYPHLNLEKILELPTAKGQNIRKKSQIYQGFSLVKCWPKTGRTHQIRVHMAHLQHPLVGDSTYAGKKRQGLDATWCPRQFLHAEQLEFTHPRTQEQVSFTAPLTADLERALSLLDVA